jgi:mono/diheme cytochrome c family protein
MLVRSEISRETKMHIAAAVGAGLTITGLVFAPMANAADAAGAMIERGRYLAKIGGCNDCHTAGYLQSSGQVPEKDWLAGDQLGWQGPWGTTYPPNLRIYFSKISEDEWVAKARTFTARPPMPWVNLREMTEQDLRALHRFVRTLGPVGKPAPSYVPPGQKAQGPVVIFPAPPK